MTGHQHTRIHENPIYRNARNKNISGIIKKKQITGKPYITQVLTQRIVNHPLQQCFNYAS